MSYIFCSEMAANSLKSYSPDIIVVPALGRDVDPEFGLQFSEMEFVLKRATVAVIGPGLSRSFWLVQKAKRLAFKLMNLKVPLIIDGVNTALIYRTDFNYLKMQVYCNTINFL